MSIMGAEGLAEWKSRTHIVLGNENHPPGGWALTITKYSS